MTAAVVLPSRLDLPAAAPLAKALRAQVGGDLRIEAGDVTHLGGLCLQVLLAAAKEWRQAQKELTVLPRSTEFDTALGLFGLRPADIESRTGGAA